jgi:hypothetical protein
MNWKLKAFLFWFLAVPAFTGFPVNNVPGALLPGAGYGWLAYAALVHSAILLLLGLKAYRFATLVALLITVPVVLLGAGISYAGLLIIGWSQSQQTVYAAHYIRLAITMATVIPLALSMVAVIPIHRLESHLLQRPTGVRFAEKIALMVSRVFNHILHFVLPNILEVIREERALSAVGTPHRSKRSETVPLRRRMGGVLRMLIHIGVEAICASIRYVPLWAEEISRLPGYGGAKHKTDGAESSEKEKE